MTRNHQNFFNGEAGMQAATPHNCGTSCENVKKIRRAPSFQLQLSAWGKLRIYRLQNGLATTRISHPFSLNGSRGEIQAIWFAIIAHHAII